MKNPKGIIRILLVCVMMIALGLAFNIEEDYRYLPFMVIIAFVTLLFFLVTISWSGLKNNHKTLFIFLVSLAEMLWLGWTGVALSWRFALGFMGAVCAAWFILNLIYTYIRQRRIISRWNAAHTAWKSGGSAEDYLNAMEQCEAELKTNTGMMLIYGGIPLNDYISVHKILLFKEMGEAEKCLALLKTIRPKIKNAEVEKTLLEIETELLENCEH